MSVAARHACLDEVKDRYVRRDGVQCFREEAAGAVSVFPVGLFADVEARLWRGLLVRVFDGGIILAGDGARCRACDAVILCVGLGWSVLALRILSNFRLCHGVLLTFSQ